MREDSRARSNASVPEPHQETRNVPGFRDGTCAAGQGDDVIFMIEQEYCFLSRDGTHTYLNGNKYCCHCGTRHPSIRNACGQR